MEYKSFDEYQQKAATFALERAWHPFYLLTGLAAEVGELSGMYAKEFRDKWEPNDEEEFEKHETLKKKELGDILWFVAALCTLKGLNMSEIAAMNIAKLEDRKARNVISGSGDNR